MPSLFANLFRYARASDSHPLENFSTEALAACIRDDPAPIGRLLASVGLLGSPVIGDVTADTQVWIPTVGCIDLVLRGHESGKRFEFWFEIKVNAGESGNQLSRYVTAAKSSGHDVRVVTLGPRSLATVEAIVHVPWQALWRDARAADRASKYWHEFAAHLQEIGMADPYDSPVSDKEAASFGHAIALERRTRRILTKFATRAKEIWPAGEWSNSDFDLRWEMHSQFHRHGRWGTFRPKGRSVIVGALVRPDPEGRALLSAWIEVNPKLLDARRRMLEAADAAGLDSSVWSRRAKGWQVLVAEAPLMSQPDLDAAAGWLVARLTELREKGLLDLVTRLASDAPAAPVDEESEERT